jgi:hypothetical protein
VNGLEAFEADFPAPLAKIRSRIVEGIAEFDKHVQRHEQPKQILAAGIVNQGLDGDQGASRWQGVVGGADQLQLLLQIPIVKNHAHCDEIGFG